MTPSFSTGPRTQEGKARSSQNARTHGLTAKHLKISEDDRPAFESLDQALSQQLNPQGELEHSLTDRIIRAHWDLRKIDSLEADLLNSLDPFNDKHTLALNRLSLYRTRTENGLSKALQELRSLQEERQLRAAALKDDHHHFSPIIRITNIQRDFAFFSRPKNQTPKPANQQEQ